MALFSFIGRNRLLKKAEQLSRSRDFDSAMKIVDELREASPKDATLLLHAAVIAFERKSIDQSKNYIDEALKLQQDNPILHLAMGEVLYAQKDYEGSMQALEKSLELSPDNPKAAYLLGLNCIALEREEEAAMHFENVAREDQDFLLARLLTIGEKWALHK